MSETSNQQPATVAPLAIIVPAYKAKFLREALASIAAQTDQRFQLYIFDDASPEPIAAVAGEFAGRRPFHFHRFEDNLGKKSLVGQWERCLRRTCEPWVWIFSDDDVMEAGCVASFHAELDRTQSAHDLYRFNTRWIDEAGARILESPQHPHTENGADFLMARLAKNRHATLQEIIFSRQAWESVGGIPDFPLGWHSDVAITASLGVGKTLCTIPGAWVDWRSGGTSEINISSTTSFRVTNRKIIATAIFSRWLEGFYRKNAPAQTPLATRLSEQRLMEYLDNVWNFLSLRTCLALDSLAAEVWGHPRGWGLWQGLKVDSRLLKGKIGRLFPQKKIILK